MVERPFNSLPHRLWPAPPEGVPAVASLYPGGQRRGCLFRRYPPQRRKLEVRVVAGVSVGELHPFLAGALGNELPRALPDRESTGVLDESCAARARIAEERGQNIRLSVEVFTSNFCPTSAANVAGKSTWQISASDTPGFTRPGQRTMNGTRVRLQRCCTCPRATDRLVCGRQAFPSRRPCSRHPPRDHCRW